MTAHRVLYGVTGQTLVHTPAGYVSSATYTIENLRFAADASEREIASGSATVASWSLTSSATAGPTVANARRFTTASTTGASIGDPAVLTAPDGSSELVEVAAISSGSYVEMVSPIAGTYPSGSTLRGIKISASFPNAYAADEDELEREPFLRITWIYSLAGRTWRVPEMIDWSRHSTGDIDLGAAILELRTLYPDLPARLPDGARLENAAATLVRRVQDDLRARKLDPTTVLFGDRARALLVARMAWWASTLGYSPGVCDLRAFQASAQADYQHELATLTVGLGILGTKAVDVTDSQAKPPISPITFAM